jgi:hypothetical protein
MLGPPPLAVLASRALFAVPGGAAAAAEVAASPPTPPPTLFNQLAPAGLMHPTASLERLRRVRYRRASPDETQLVGCRAGGRAGRGGQLAPSSAPPRHTRAGPLNPPRPHLPPPPPTPPPPPAQATWYLPDADEEGVLAQPAQARLRSVHSKQAAVITFRNASARPVRALWVDFDGNEVRRARGKGARGGAVCLAGRGACCCLAAWLHAACLHAALARPPLARAHACPRRAPLSPRAGGLLRGGAWYLAPVPHVSGLWGVGKACMISLLLLAALNTARPPRQIPLSPRPHPHPAPHAPHAATCPTPGSCASSPRARACCCRAPPRLWACRRSRP